MWQHTEEHSHGDWITSLAGNLLQNLRLIMNTAVGCFCGFSCWTLYVEKFWMVLVGPYVLGVDIVVSASCFGVVFVGLFFTIGGNGCRSVPYVSLALKFWLKA